MLDFPRWKVVAISLVILFGIAFAIPSFFSREQVATWPSYVPRSQISLGLDLAGGSHLLLEADDADAAKQRVTAMEEQTRCVIKRTPIVEEKTVFVTVCEPVIHKGKKTTGEIL